MMNSKFTYRLVQLVNGAHSIHSVAEHETFHPVIGPVAEAEALYVKQMRLPERAARHAGEMVVWDVGLGAGANALTVLRALRGAACPIHLFSFDHTLAPLSFGLEHRETLGYFEGYEQAIEILLRDKRVEFRDGNHQVRWEVQVADFPTLVNQAGAEKWPKPHTILFDAFSPAKNPEMWTLPLFRRIYSLLDPARPCAMPTYSRSTLLRVSWLLAGFYVGIGHATGEKEETTIAANSLELLAEPLDHRWLQRVRRSTSAEPLQEPVYRQARLSEGNWDKLERHPQFAGAVS